MTITFDLNKPGQSIQDELEMAAKILAFLREEGLSAANPNHCLHCHKPLTLNSSGGWQDSQGETICGQGKWHEVAA